MKVDTYKCDNCGAARKEANHWFLMLGTPHLAQLMHWEDSQTEGMSHACGRECAFAMLTRWMGTGKFEREALAPGSFEKKGAA